MTAAERSTLDMVIAQLDRMESKVDGIDQRVRTVEIATAASAAVGPKLDDIEKRTEQLEDERVQRRALGDLGAKTWGVVAAIAIVLVNVPAALLAGRAL